uniref:Uncharacterized protein n=1 Tax=Rhizophora mucronata TaxID=61149 RepID=A0A2P2KPI5_RHIMU
MESLEERLRLDGLPLVAAAAAAVAQSELLPEVITIRL